MFVIVAEFMFVLGHTAKQTTIRLHFLWYQYICVSAMKNVYTFKISILIL